tara:strand:- start:53 stop:580 length:528 start_codon:yes stop_codon:yes gene_type:complete
MPYYWEHTDLPLGRNKSFSKGGVNYPSNWLAHSNEDQRKELGIIWKDEDRPRKDERFYNIRGKQGDWTVTEKDLDVLKAAAVSSCKEIAGNLLSRSDWMTIREAETDTPMPEDWLAYRQAIRDYSNSLETAIEACDFDSLQKLKRVWPESPTEKAEREKREAEEAARDENGPPNL